MGGRTTSGAGSAFRKITCRNVEVVLCDRNETKAVLSSVSQKKTMAGYTIATTGVTTC
jgi:hypothetical protein